ncbi:HWE histidine kinase domain-containing protein [Phenylobacterium sp.]|uniref:sensor histidine kinase n=1 Tax=Phenylobacterium sp. TaxID=1871053 RepID=UPI0026036273|nr:HWE histidine kinase domain-containing protein [Phenylobacterium sp.]
MPQIDFRALFETLPSPHMVLDRDLCFVEANLAYQRVTERTRDQLIGGNIFDLFPNPGEGGRRLRDSFERVLATGQPDTLALIPYAIALPVSRGGGFEMRFWSAVHTPLFDEGGKVAYILQNTVDVTEIQRLKDMAFGPAGALDAPLESATHLYQRAQELQETNLILVEETNQIRNLFMQAPGFMAVLIGPDFVFRLVNNAYQNLIGGRAVIGRPLAEALPELEGQAFQNILHDVMVTGQPYLGQAASVMLQRQAEGPPEERFVDFIYQPILDARGAPWGVFVEGSDVTDRVRAERQQKLLLDELNHRVKNTLATVQAIAAQTLRTTASPAAFRESFEARLLALSATHDLLTQSVWQGAPLEDVILMELRPHGVERYQLEGPEVALSPAETLTLGLVFHELVTNAAKYGALSTSEGCVRVRWQVRDQDERRLELTWSEEGGPKVSPPTRQGFGSRLIERSLQGDIDGEARLDFDEGGLKCHLMMRLQAQQTGDAAAA